MRTLAVTNIAEANAILMTKNLLDIVSSNTERTLELRFPFIEKGQQCVTAVTDRRFLSNAHASACRCRFLGKYRVLSASALFAPWPDGSTCVSAHPRIHVMLVEREGMSVSLRTTMVVSLRPFGHTCLVLRC